MKTVNVVDVIQKNIAMSAEDGHFYLSSLMIISNTNLY